MMKKIVISLAAVVSILLTGCGMLGQNGGNGTGNNGLGDVLGGVLGTLGSPTTGNSLLNMVIGYVKVGQRELIGSWQYNAPGCAFTSENLLAKAGGALAAGQVKDKLMPIYQTVGINSGNTTFTFTQDGQFQARLAGIPLSGTYSYDRESSALKMKTMLFSLTGFVTRTTNGVALTFESKKLLTVLQAATSLSGNSTVKTVGDISRQFDGVRLGFEMVR